MQGNWSLRFLTRSDTNWHEKLQKKATSLKIQIKKVVIVLS